MDKRDIHKKDAPGWSGDTCNTDGDQELGPLCWKCKGTKKQETKDKMKKEVVEIVCKVCHGVGRVKRKRKEAQNLDKPGKVSKRQRPVPDDWLVPGPEARGGVEPVEGEEICHLLGHWRIFQRVGGHRWSTDDLVTAWVAGRSWRELHGEAVSPKYCLDLGCGIGSVLMMVAWQFPNAKCLGVEAQELSASMAKRSIRYNGCETRVNVENGDIRTFEGFDKYSDGDGKFDLVTGTPPYFKVDFAKETGTATTKIGGLPSCHQSAPARYEFRGGIEAYCLAAKPRLRDENSRFVVVEGGLDINQKRVEAGAEQAGLHIVRQVSVHGRDDKPALFAVYEMKLAPSEEKPVVKHEKLDVRLKGGRRSEEYNQLMISMGIPP